MEGWIVRNPALLGGPPSDLISESIVLVDVDHTSELKELPEVLLQEFCRFRELCEQIGVRVTRLQAGEYQPDQIFSISRYEWRDRKGEFAMDVFTDDPVHWLLKRRHRAVVFITDNNVIGLNEWHNLHCYLDRKKARDLRIAALLMIVNGRRRGNPRILPELWKYMKEESFL
jgi:hypothetical protein